LTKPLTNLGFSDKGRDEGFDKVEDKVEDKGLATTEYGSPIFHAGG
jgi:hypothetical protein